MFVLVQTENNNQIYIKFNVIKFTSQFNKFTYSAYKKTTKLFKGIENVTLIENQKPLRYFCNSLNLHLCISNNIENKEYFI